MAGMLVSPKEKYAWALIHVTCMIIFTVQIRFCILTASFSVSQ